MKKCDLLKPGLRATQLTALAREINNRQETIELAKHKVTECAATLVCEAIFQGQAFLKVKKILKHGDFMPWVRAHCPLISHQTVNNYMRLAVNAANSQRAKNLERAASIREALLLCDLDESKANGEADGECQPRSWPPSIEVLSRLSRIMRLIEKHPVQSWPQEVREKLQEDLLPIAVALWPEKFTQAAPQKQYSDYSECARIVAYRAS